MTSLIPPYLDRTSTWSMLENHATLMHSPLVAATMEESPRESCNWVIAVSDAVANVHLVRIFEGC